LKSNYLIKIRRNVRLIRPPISTSVARTDAEWESVFRAFFTSLSPGGSLWIFDLIEAATPALQAMFWRRYGEYLAGFKGEKYRDEVFAYVEKEDTPRSLIFQLEMLRRVGFRDVDVLHKNGCFAAFGAIRGVT